MARFRTPWLLPLLLLLFVASGACGLVYQVLWTRALGLVFGVTVYAASTVWASFMAGLALGSYLVGRIGDRVQRPLAWFGAAELLVGLSALATPAATAYLLRAYPAIQAVAPDSLAALTGLRLAVSLAVLIVPTTLMGATLPLVVRSSLVQGADLGQRVSLLYGTNTAGAIAGTLLAGLWLIPGIGMTATLWTAAATNVTIGIVALLAGWAMPAMSASRGGATALAASDDAADASEATPRVRTLVLVVFAISGFATLALEVIWFRVIILMLRPTVYGFAILLATVLTGIAVGSWLATPFMARRRNWVAVLAWLELAMAAAVLFSFAFLNVTPALTRWAEPHLARVMPAYLAFPIVASVPAILPAALLMGLAFPIGLRLYTGSASGSAGRVAERIGFFYAINVCGAILGSLAAGFVMLPVLGSRTSLLVTAATIGASGLWLLAAGVRRAVAAAVAAAAVVGFVWAGARLDDPFVAAMNVRHPNHTMEWAEESVQGTVATLRAPGGRLGLYIEGNHQASEAGSMVFVHRRIGHLPMVLHPDARTALVVGLGGGATAGAVAVHNPVDVDVVELSAAVLKGAAFFSHVNHDVLRRPNVAFKVDDGRNYLLRSPVQYDVVTADLILPFDAGANNLYSADYFALVRRALRPGGIAVQWVSGTDTEYKLIMRTFLSVFPDATLWADGSLMIGASAPLALSRSAFDRKLNAPGRQEILAEMGIATFDDLCRMFTAGADEMRAFVGQGPILTDDRPLAEYFLSLPRGRRPDLTSLRGDIRRYLAAD